MRKHNDFSRAKVGFSSENDRTIPNCGVGDSYNAQLVKRIQNGFIVSTRYLNKNSLVNFGANIKKS